VLIFSVYAAATVLFIPGSILTIAAGFIYGLGQAIPIISVGSTLGATIAFLLGRFLIRSLIERKIKKYPRFHAIDKAIAVEGWKIVLLLRLIPLIPFNLLNYALALTSVSLKAYVLASWIGMLPGTILFIYIGTTAKDLTDIITGKVNTQTLGLRIGFAVISGVLFIGVFIFIIFIARRAMKKYIKEGPDYGYVYDPVDEKFENKVLDENDATTQISDDEEESIILYSTIEDPYEPINKD
jgi:uncharacterized membrane protein YdjX (TVP38/TMEM64 family)